MRTKKIWIVPLVIPSVLIALVSVIYIGSVINPTGHLHSLPVMVVNEEVGASAGGHEVNLGAIIVDALGVPVVWRATYICWDA